MRPAVYAAGIIVDLGRHRVLDGVDLTVGNGDWVTVIGPNGAGKSTLLRALAGLVPATGRIELFGTDLATMSRRDRARRVAVVPQRASLPEGMTLEHYVLLGRTPHLAPLAAEGPADLVIANDAIATLELADLATRRLDTLSGGERQRAVLACAGIAASPSSPRCTTSRWRPSPATTSCSSPTVTSSRQARRSRSSPDRMSPATTAPTST